MSCMKVLHVIPGLPKAAGTSVFCCELCGGLSQAGCECEIAVQRLDDDVYPVRPAVAVLEAGDGFRCLPFRPDLVHIHALWNPFLHRAAVWARKAKIPIVYSPHGMLTPWALGQKRLKKWTALALYQYWDLRNAALIHVTAESESRDVRRLGLTNPLVVLPLGVGVTPEPPTLRHNNPRIALFVSRVHPKKGLFNLVDAWALLKRRPATIGDWRFVIAGPDEEGCAAAVMARANAAGVGGDFELVGPIFGRQKEDLYAHADLFVLPTFSENFGVVVIEALAHGCPVITTKGAPWAELENCGNAGMRQCHNEGDGNKAITQSGNPAFQPGRAGWWIDIGVEPLADALREAMALTDEERWAMGRNGRILVETKYTWPAITTQMKSAYERVLEHGSRP